MKLIQLLIASVLITSLSTAHAEETTDDPTQDQYQAAITSFGVAESVFETASSEAVNIAPEKRLEEEFDPLAHLPLDWLESSPYSIPAWKQATAAGLRNYCATRS